MANIHNTKYGKYYPLILQYYNESKTPKEIVKLLNDPCITKPIQVTKIASRLGCTRKTKIQDKFSTVDEIALKLIQSGKSCVQTAKQLNIDCQSMTRRLKKKYGLTILPDGKKNVDSTYFSKIDTEEKAYWLGFLYADGYVSQRGSIELCLKDKDHVEKFKNAIHSEHKISKKNVTLKGKTFVEYKISIRDSKIVSDLEKYECFSNKTFTIECPQLDSLELYRHFVRGYFDGDGCLTVDKRNNISCQFTCGSYSFIKSLQSYLREVVHIDTTLRIIKNENAYDLRTKSSGDAFHLVDFLYDKSSIYLNRKYDKYLNVCRSRNILQDSLNYEDGIKRGWRNVGITTDSLPEPKAI
jgi:DNA-binding transcriptional regulator WhiA